MKLKELRKETNFETIVKDNEGCPFKIYQNIREMVTEIMWNRYLCMSIYTVCWKEKCVSA